LEEQHTKGRGKEPRAKNGPCAHTRKLTTHLNHHNDFTLDIQLTHLTQPAVMGRLHSNGKGISSSAIPYSRTAPAWLKTTPEQVVDQICKLAKKGLTPSQIGVILRDSHGIAQVRVVTGEFPSRYDLHVKLLEEKLTCCAGNKVLRILKGNGRIAPI
jgi:hypothetical protein